MDRDCGALSVTIPSLIGRLPTVGLEAVGPGRGASACVSRALNRLAGLPFMAGRYMAALTADTGDCDEKGVFLATASVSHSAARRLRRPSAQ